MSQLATAAHPAHDAILSTTVARSRLGVVARTANADAVRDARRDLAAANIAAAIERALAAAPQLTDEQAERLAARLRRGGSR